MLYDSMLGAIGDTPILRLERLTEYAGVTGDIFAKLEYMNPTGSVKDRAAKSMILAAMERGELGANGTVIEATSGNIGISIAAVTRILGLDCIIVMPSDVTRERVDMIKALGGHVVLTDPGLGMKGAMREAERISMEKNGYILRQFENADNANVHYIQTAKEIYRDMDGRIDAFVCGIGTGGTFSGVARYLKKRIPHMDAIAVEPALSPYIQFSVSGKHKIYGIGAGFLPPLFDSALCDGVIGVEDDDAIEYARLLMRTEGIMCGISSGAAVCAAVRLLKMKAEKYERIALILPDSADRYYSTELFCVNKDPI